MQPRVLDKHGTTEDRLCGEFQGKDTVMVDVKVVGDKKQLIFEGIVTGGEAAVAGAAPAGDAGTSGEAATT